MIRFITDEKSIREYFGKLPILNVDLDLTRRCNLRCAHCFISAGGIGRGELRTHEFMRVINELANLGTIEITFGGGEPFLRRDAPELVAFASQRGITCRIVTNGTLLSARIVAALRGLRVSVLQVSLDGDQCTHDWFRGTRGSFLAAVHGAKLALEAGLPLVVNTVVTVENRASLDNLLPTIRDLRPRAWRLVPTLHLAGRAALGTVHPLPVGEVIALSDWVRKIRHTLKSDLTTVLPPALLPESNRTGDLGCNLLVQCAVMADGTVAPCAGFSGEREFHAGNVRTSSIRAIWQRSPVFQRIRSAMREPPTGLCGRCGMYGTCLAFCRAQSYAVFRRLDAPMPICQSYADVGVLGTVRFSGAGPRAFAGSGPPKCQEKGDRS